MNIEKGEIRKELLNKRNSLTYQEIEERSKIICNILKGFEQYKKANVIFAYASAKNEVETRSLLQDSINEGKTVCLPCSIKHSSQLEFFRVIDLNKDLKIGNYEIFEPIPDAQKIVLPQETELIIIPGVAFDLNLNRIGYGKGYYDNYLPITSKNIPKIALAFDFQILESVPSEANDIKMDMIITEKRIIKNK